MTVPNPGSTNPLTCPTCSDTSFLTDEIRVKYVKPSTIVNSNYNDEDYVAIIDKDEIKKVESTRRWQRTLPKHDLAGWKYAETVHKYITKHNGRFLCDDKGNYHVLIGNQRVPLLYSDDNHALADVVLKACNITLVTQEARVAVQRLTNIAWQSSSRLMFKQFSATVKDQQNRSSIYIPISTGEVLRIDASGDAIVRNGDNEASLWLEHPCQDPLKWTPFENKVRDTLRNFERLLVDTQACAVPEMRWFVAMHEGLFPYVRDAYPARMILVHRGGSQSGKTSGAQRFTKLHGLGAVKGDYSPAALRNMLDIGLLVLDNKEQANFTQELIDYLLNLATGAEHGRSNVDGTLRKSGNDRPVGVITSIEGVVKIELHKRCVEIEYRVPDGVDKLRREPIESEISDLRHNITSALVPVLETYLALRREFIPTPNPLPDFEEHFTTLCYLLRAYSRVMAHPDDWAEKIITVWAKTLNKTDNPEDGNELEDHILWLLRDGKLSFGVDKHPF